MAPTRGNFATWSRDGTKIYYERSNGSFAQPRPWFRLDVKTGKSEQIEMRANALRPILSPDGTRIAYDDGRAHPSVYVYDLISGVEHHVATNAVAPVWFSNDEIAVTSTRLCHGSDECYVDDWAPVGHTSLIALRSLSQRPLNLPDTLGVSILR